MDDLIRSVEEDFVQDDIPDVEPGDKVRITEIVEGGDQKRTQRFEGVILKKSGSGTNQMVSVRRIASGIGVEKTFPLHSPKIDKVDLIQKGDVGQARPYYLRKDSPS